MEARKKTEEKSKPESAPEKDGLPKPQCSFTSDCPKEDNDHEQRKKVWNNLRFGLVRLG